MTLQNFTLGTFSQGAAGGGSFESIASASGTGSSGTITFSSIPGTYQHLQIRGLGRTSAAGTYSDLLVRVNSDSGANYTQHRLYGNGASAAASGSTGNTSAFVFNAIAASGSTANVLGSIVLDFHDYVSTTRNKTIRSFSGIDDNTTGSVNLISNLWINTNAITSISLIAGGSGNWTTTTTFALYGIKGA